MNWQCLVRGRCLNDVANQVNTALTAWLTPYRTSCHQDEKTFLTFISKLQACSWSLSVHKNHPLAYKKHHRVSATSTHSYSAQHAKAVIQVSHQAPATSGNGPLKSESMPTT